MSIEISSSQYTTSLQTLRNLHVRIDLLDFNFFVVNDIEGNAIDGSVAINATSDIRRTCNISFTVTDSSFDIKAGGQVWLDKYIQLYIGIDDVRTQQITWTNLGIFLINEPSYIYDSTTKTMSFQCVDLMAKLTGLRNGEIVGIGSEGYTLIPAGSNVREAIVSIIKNCGFNRYYVSECTNVDGIIQEVPYDMKFQQGTTWYEILEELSNILPNYQIYFDVDGVFRYEPIPSGENDSIMMDETLWKENVISESINISFNDVKNFVEVWGRVHETDYYSDTTATLISNNIIQPTWTGLIQLDDYVITALSLSQEVTNESGIYISFLNRMLFIKDFNENNITYLPKDEYLVFAYSEKGYWLYLGGAQAHAIFEDDNPESPFYVGSTIGTIPIVLSGEDYENIISDDLALERAKFEIYNRCRLNDSINLTTVPIYWADVNWKVSYTPLSGEREKAEYMIKSINIPLSTNGTQTFNLIRFYPFYPVIS